MTLSDSRDPCLLRRRLTHGIGTLALAFCLAFPAAAQEAETCEEREAKADSIADACSRDCRFEWTRALRIEFSCRVEDEVRAARRLALAIDSEQDGYWVDAYVALLVPLPEDAEWVQRYWSDRMDDEGRLPPDLRTDLVGEVRRIARIQRDQVHRLIEWYTAIARHRGLDPQSIVRDPFRQVDGWLDEE